MASSLHTPVDGLEASFDRETVYALRAWADRLNRSVSAPSRPWSGVGYSSALVGAIVLGPADRTTAGKIEKLIVKVCSAGRSAEEEARRHEAAWHSAPRFAERHLVRQPYPPHPIGDGRFLMFQEIAGNLREITPLNLLRIDQRPVLLGETTRLVLEEWNERGPRRYTADAAEYLRIELRDALAENPAMLDERWIRTAEDSRLDILPNPAHLAGPDSLISDVSVDYLAGNAHGDLHLANVVVPVPPQQEPVLTDLRLVDNSAYSEDAPLTRDPVTLMLSALLTIVGDLPEDQAERLLEYVITPREIFPADFPQVYSQLVWSIYEPGLLFAQSLGEEWRAQYLLSLTAHALAHSFFDNAGATGRWWYFRLAARAGAAFLADLPHPPVPEHAHLIEPPQVERLGLGRVDGPLVMAPPYGERMIERTGLMEKILSLLRDPTRKVVELGAVLEGTGGFGKTVLADQICRREEVQELFQDGIFWVDLGERVDGAELASKINDLSEIVSGHRPTLSVPEIAGAQFARLISNMSILLVIDDVWTIGQLRPFLHGAPRCVRLVTTRNRTLAPQDAPVITVGEMERDEAVSLLTAGLSTLSPRELDELLRMTGRWPLLLSLVNRAIRSAIRDGASAATAAQDVMVRLRAGGPTALDLTSAGDRSRAVRATMEACLGPLDDNHLNRLLELSIFSEDTDIPLDVLELYWRLPPADVAHLCETFADLSLISLHQGTRPIIRLHDMVRAYLRDRNGSGRLVDLNRAFLDRLRSRVPRGEPTRWWELPAEPRYVWRYLTYHLAEAGLQHELAALICELRYVAAKLEMFGPVPVEADLAVGSSQFARELLWGLQRSSHLLTATTPSSSVTDVFLSRLSDVEELQPAIEAYYRNSLGSRLRTAWPPPDLPHPALRRIIHGHTAPLGGCALSGDGEKLITSGDDSARVWDMTTGQLLSVLEGHVGPILSCAISPDGTWAATTGDDHTVRLWDLATGSERSVLSGHGAVVRRCAISPDGTWLASAGDDHSVRLWDSRTGNELSQLAGHTGAVRSCAISRDGRRLVSAGGDGTVRVWDLAKGRLQAICEGHSGAVRNCAVSKDGQWVVSAGGDGTVRLSDATTGHLVRVFEGHRGSVRACAISSDDALVVSGGSDGTVRLWEASTGRQLNIMPGHDAAVRGCVISDDGAWLVSVGEDRTIRTWDLRRALAGSTMRHQVRAVVRACAAFPGDNRLASGGTDASVRVWDVETGRLIHNLGGHESTVRCCSVSPDGSRLASGGDDKTVRIWDTTSGELITRLDGHNAAVRDCAFGPAGKWLVSAASDGLVRVWDLATSTVRREFGRQGVAIWACAMPPDGSWLATVGDDSVLRLWDVESGEMYAELPGHQGTTWACAAGPDGKWVATAGNDHVVRLWDVDNRCEFGVLSGHRAWLNACCTSPDGRWMASAGYDPTIRVWDVAKSKIANELKGHDGVIWALAAGGRGDWIASAAGDETIRIWDPYTAAPRAVLDINATALRGCAPAPSTAWAVCVGGTGTAYRLDLNSGERTDLPLAASVSYNACAITRDGSTVAVAGEDGGIRLWHAIDNTVDELTLSHPGAALSCAFSPDGSVLATSGGSSTILWDLALRQPRLILEGHAGWVRTCAFAPDGTWLASGGDDGIRIWDFASGRERLRLGGGHIRACTIAPDGEWLAGSDEDGVVRVWSRAEGSLIAELADHSAPLLSCPVSDDGQLLAAIANDRTIHVWDVTRKERIAAMRVEQSLRGGFWIPGDRGLCVIGEAGAYRYDLV